MISSIIVPLIVSIVLFIGLKEKIKVYDTFIEGAKEGIKTAVKLFPTLIGIFIGVNMLRSSGLIDFFVSIISKFMNTLSIASEILPLALIKPISGSAAIAVGTDIMATFGADSKLGMLAATIMGASETTFYVIALYMSQVKTNNSRKINIPAILADLTSIIVAIFLFR